MNTDRLLGLYITINQRRAEQMESTFTPTGKQEAKALFKRAYEKGVFTIDHSINVDSMTDGEINSLLTAYINRKAQKTRYLIGSGFFVSKESQVDEGPAVALEESLILPLILLPLKRPMAEYLNSN